MQMPILKNKMFSGVKNHKIQILLMFIFLLAAPLAVHAYAIEHGNAVYVGKDQTIDGNFYAAGVNVTVDGHVTGDVICAGQSIIINGTVDGDVICAGQNISVPGKVGGSIRAAGSDIDIRGAVARGVMAFGANVNIEKDARISWDVLIGAANTQVRGNMGRSLLGFGANFVLDGGIEKDATLYIGSNKGKPAILTLTDTALIKGNLVYTSAANALISPKAQVKGQTIHSLPSINTNQNNGRGGFGFLGIFIIAVLSALAAGFVMVKVLKHMITETTEAMSAKFWPTIGWGAVWTIIVPIIALILAITVIGLRLAALSIGVWLIVLMISKIIASITIGRLLIDKYWTAKKDSLNWAVTIGIILCWIVFYIPFIGWIASVVAVWWGAGGIIMSMKKFWGMKEVKKPFMSFNH